MNKQNLTIAGIRSSYSEEKRLSDRDSPWLYFVARPVSFYPTWLFLRLRISANQATFIGLIIGIIGCVFLAFGSYWAAITGAILINVGGLCDVIDGNIARYKGSCTKYGQYVDGLTAYILVPLIFICVGLGVHNHPDLYLGSAIRFLFGIDCNTALYLILGVSGAIFSIWGYLVTSSLRAVFLMKLGDFLKVYKLEANSRKSLWGIIYIFGCGLMSIVGLMLVVAAVARFLSVFLFLWVLIEMSYFIAVTVRALIFAKKQSTQNLG